VFGYVAQGDRKIVGQGCRDNYIVTIEVGKRHVLRVQEDALQQRPLADPRPDLVARLESRQLQALAAVFLIADDRVANRREVDAQLVAAVRLWPQLQQGMAQEAIPHHDVRVGLPKARALAIASDHPARSFAVGTQPGVDGDAIAPGNPCNESYIRHLQPASAQLGLAMASRLEPLGQQQATRSLTIHAHDRPQVVLGSGGLHGGERGGRSATASGGDHASRLVDDQHGRRLEQNFWGRFGDAPTRRAGRRPPGQRLTQQNDVANAQLAVVEADLTIYANPSTGNELAYLSSVNIGP